MKYLLAIVLLFFVPLTVGSSLASERHKVNVCHNGHTIRVDFHAVPAHLAHGDYLGRCDPEPTIIPDPEVVDVNPATDDNAGNDPVPQCTDVLWFVTVPGTTVESVEVYNLAGGWSPDGEVIDTVRNRPGFIVCPGSLPEGDYQLYVNNVYSATFYLYNVEFIPLATVTEFPANGVSLWADPLAPEWAFNWNEINY